MTRYLVCNAVEVARSCKNFTVKDNWIYQCYDTAITNQSRFNDDTVQSRNVENVMYTGNLIEYTDNAFEIWLSGKTANESIPAMKNITVEHNICRFTGYGFCEQRPNITVGGIISAAFGGIGVKPNRSENYMIENNIFDRTSSNIQMFFITAGEKEWLPDFEHNVYIQNYSYKFGRVDVKSEDELKLPYCEMFSKYKFNYDITKVLQEIVGDKSAVIVII